VYLIEKSISKDLTLDEKKAMEEDLLLEDNSQMGNSNNTSITSTTGKQKSTKNKNLNKFNPY
jgi:hypothetical protein